MQRKLTIGEPGDKYEQEADGVASQVVKQINTPAPQQAGQSQRRQREEVAEEEEKLQMKPMLQLRAAVGGLKATADLETEIKQARGSGQSLADSIKLPMEQAFGADFSGVKIHTDAKSDKLNQSIQAKAFTTGQAILFRQGEYDPGSQGGQELLAHELTHVIQQKGSAVKAKPDIAQRIPEGVIQRTLIKHKPKKTGECLPEIENEADRLALQVDELVMKAYEEFIKGDYTGASQAQTDLYIYRMSEYKKNKEKMHPSTAAGYVIEGKANKGIAMLGHGLQVTGRLKGTRPDVLISLSNGEEALIDITASNSIGHIFNKPGNWTKHKKIVYVAESYYPSINFDNPSSTKSLTKEEEEQARKRAEKVALNNEEAEAMKRERTIERYTEDQNKLLELLKIYYNKCIEKGRREVWRKGNRDVSGLKTVGVSVKDFDTENKKLDMERILWEDYVKGKGNESAPPSIDVDNRRQSLERKIAYLC
ncbi:DUF4157 domain-containing protein [Nostoc sp. NMS7]|uniref:eCIS core domain-containing protein n=1 Tax=Nostoc sp. NMS7 TaxID=2815391 RepID=UPI0025E88604|nr:DUF4157 domain-containing protein [Nostoc sp. NMS7]